MHTVVRSVVLTWILFISLSLSAIGLAGTPDPEQPGRTASSPQFTAQEIRLRLNVVEMQHANILAQLDSWHARSRALMLMPRPAGTGGYRIDQARMLANANIQRLTAEKSGLERQITRLRKALPPDPPQTQPTE